MPPVRDKLLFCIFMLLMQAILPVSILAAKTRVTPHKPLPPRLELMGAHILGQLTIHYVNLLSNSVYYSGQHPALSRHFVKLW